MSLTNSTDASHFHREILKPGSLQAPRFLLLILALTLAAISADQFAAPILYTTSPLWAAAAAFLLVWRRGETSLSSGDTPASFPLSTARLSAFLAVHVALILIARSLTDVLQSFAGTMVPWGTAIAALKLCVLIPTLMLLPPAAWARVANEYSSEGTAAIVVLITFFPRRAFEAMWPWYGQALGRFVFHLAGLFVSGLGYVKALTPTLTGSQLDVTIIQACSGIEGLELFDFLFALVAVCDWKRLRKGRALFVYFAGLFAMLLGNTLRITTFVVLGNHGFAEPVSRFHLSAGWIFFSVIFLLYLALTYSWMVAKRHALPELQHAG